VTVVSDAQAEVLRQLERAYERHAVAEQVARQNEPDLAEEYHAFAVRVLRARMAEDEDKRPEPPTVHCLACGMVYARTDR
jgi:hypothetical protein